MLVVAGDHRPLDGSKSHESRTVSKVKVNFVSIHPRREQCRGGMSCCVSDHGLPSNRPRVAGGPEEGGR